MIRPINYSRLVLAAVAVALALAVELDASERSSVSCLDENGKPVDWFIAYKFPIMTDQPEPYRSGLGYAYITSELNAGAAADSEQLNLEPNQIEDEDLFIDQFKRLLLNHLATGDGKEAAAGTDGGKPARWTIARLPIDHPDSMVLRTLAPVYSERRPDSLNWIFYNDQPPTFANGEPTKRSSMTRGHSKGALLVDSERGDSLWLSHSVPQFPPPLPDRLMFNSNSFRHAQTFMCVSLDFRTEGQKVADHLATLYALVFNSRVNEQLWSMQPELKKLKFEWDSGMRRARDRLATLEQTLVSRAGQAVGLFAKSANLQEDMYAGWLNRELNSSLYVESWRNGIGSPLDSECPGPAYHVNNVENLKLLDERAQVLFKWHYLKDHSKWAISETRDEGMVCIADINRMASQFNRGGGALCLRCPKCWSVFSDTIDVVEPCKTFANKQPKQPPKAAGEQQQQQQLKQSRSSKSIARSKSRIARSKSLDVAELRKLL